MTIWNLFWLLNFGALLGLAIDTTAAMNLKARLQEASDAASSAAVIDIFPVADGATPVALDYAQMNLGENTAVQDQDVTAGYWDSATRTFATNDIPFANAIRVIARHDTARGNQLGTVLLHVAGFDAWDVGAVSTSAYAGISAVDRCFTDGLFAGGLMEMTSNNTVTGDYCMHGEGGLKINSNNVVTCGVEISTTGPDAWKTGQPPSGNRPEDCNTDYGALTNDQMIEQTTVYRSLPSTASQEYFNVKKILDAFVNGAQVNDPFNAIPPYLTTVTVSDAATVTKAASQGKLVPGALYYIPCASNDKLSLEGVIQNVGFYTNCEIDVKKDKQVSKVKPDKVTGGYNKKNLCDPDDQTCDQVPWDAYLTPLMSCADAVSAGYETYTTIYDTAPGRFYRDGKTTDNDQQACGIEPGANGLWDNVFVFTTAYEKGDHGKKAVTFPNNMQVGRMDACTEGGGVRIYAGGSMDTPSGTIVHGSQFVLLGDTHMAAKASGVYGTTVMAAGEIQFSAQGQLGGCPADESARASDVVSTVRPVMIVD